MYDSVIRTCQDADPQEEIHSHPRRTARRARHEMYALPGRLMDVMVNEAEKREQLSKPILSISKNRRL
jgi:hypothetical protein